MKQVKILLVEEVYTDEYSNQVIRDSISDWEEVDDEDFHYLKMNMGRIWNKFGLGTTFRPILLCKDDRPVSVRIDSIKEEIAKQKKADEARKQEENERKNARLLKKQAKTEAQELALLEALQKKFKVAPPGSGKFTKEKS